MIGIENKDTAFFTVESPDVTLENQDMSKDLISLSITERTGAMPQGTLQFRDESHLYSRILRTGAELVISWGYRDPDQAPDSILPRRLNLDEITGPLIRRGLRGFVSSPSGSGNDQGDITYNCNFTAFGMRGNQDYVWYRSGNRFSVINQVFDQIGVDPIRRFISFPTATKAVTQENAVLQEESSFRFLTRLAVEWRALFQLGFAADGAIVGIFTERENLRDNNLLPQWVNNATGRSNIIGYKGEIANVRSYNWRSLESESGVGDSVQLEFIDGQPVFRRYVAEQEKVITYKLNEQKIQQELDVDGIAAQARIAKDLLSASDFEEVKRFFDPIEETTAPQGYGYRINCEMIGNPLFSPPNEIVINNGFPDRITSGEQKRFYLEQVVHNISQAGYTMSIEVVDQFVLSDIGLVVR